MKINPKRRLVRETDVHERTQAVMVELQPRTIEVWLKGSRDKFSLHYTDLLDVVRRKGARS